MAEMSSKERIAQLEAENAALKANQGGSQGPLHPAVHPQFFNGSVVLHAGAPHRVVGRSIDWDGNTTYDLAPVKGSVVHVTPDKQIERFDLKHEQARAALPGIRTYDISELGSERVFDVPEANLEAFHEHDTHAHAVAEEESKHSRQRGGEQVSVAEGAGIRRE